MELTETECAYLAGLIDGEGCIRIDRIHHNTTKNKNIVYRPIISITQKGRTLIDNVAMIYKPAAIIKHHGKKHENQFRIVWTYGRAYSLLEKVRPFIKGPKIKQIDLVLRFKEHMVPSNAGRGLSKEEVEWRDVQCKVLSYLKKDV